MNKLIACGIAVFLWVPFVALAQIELPSMTSTGVELPPPLELEILMLDQICIEAGLLAQLKDAEENPDKYPKLFPMEGAQIPTEFNFSKLPPRALVSFYWAQENSFLNPADIREIQREAAFRIHNGRVYIDDTEIGNISDVFTPLCRDEVRGEGMRASHNEAMAEAMQDVNFDDISDFDLEDFQVPNAVDLPSLDMTPMPTE